MEASGGRHSIEAGIAAEKAIMAQACRWAESLGPLAADRGVPYDIVLAKEKYAPPRSVFSTKGSTVRHPVARAWWIVGRLGAEKQTVITGPRTSEHALMLTSDGQLVVTAQTRKPWPDGDIIGLPIISERSYDSSQHNWPKQILALAPPSFDNGGKSGATAMQAISDGLIAFANTHHLDEPSGGPAYYL
jgi:hypothetical protein